MFKCLSGFVVAILVAWSGLCTAQPNITKVLLDPPLVRTIALILPLKSPDFGRAAEALRQGFFAAHKLSDEKIVVRLFPTDAEAKNILAAYQSAQEQGAHLIVGPMTRNGVTAIATSSLPRIPTLALNGPENDVPLPRDFYTFGLGVDAESRQLAGLEFDGKKRNALLIGSGALAKRSQDAFAEAWQHAGGQILETLSVNPTDTAPAALGQRVQKSGAQIVFLGGDAQQIKRIRPYIGNALTLLATSQVFTKPGAGGVSNHDLDGIRFLEMPWFLQPDHPAVMVYPRPEPTLSTELERFYALGIDAFRVGSELLRNNFGLDIDGVTGRLTVREGNIERQPLEAIYHNGIAIPLQ